MPKPLVLNFLDGRLEVAGQCLRGTTPADHVEDGNTRP